MELEFSIDSSQDENIRHAIKIANLFLKTSTVKHLMRVRFRVDLDQCSKKIKNVKIVYGIPNNNFREEILACTERKADANTIFLNEIYRERFDLLKQSHQFDSKEVQFLIIHMAILLVHEVAHLVFRWKGVLDSPSFFREAGNFIETILFGGIVRLLIKPNKVWSSKSECIGIGVERYIESEGFKIFEMVKSEYLEKIYSNTLSDEYYEVPMLKEEEIGSKDVRALRQLDEKVEKGLDRKALEERIGPFMILEDLGIKKCKCI